MRAYPNSVTEKELRTSVVGYAAGTNTDSVYQRVHKSRQFLADSGAGICILTAAAGYRVDVKGPSPKERERREKREREREREREKKDVTVGSDLMIDLS